MKAPDMPGRIIAHMAIAPDKKINQNASGVSVGERIVMKYATTIPKINDTAVATFHFRMVLNISGEEIRIKPKKNDHV
jgi:hypothetical protein